MENLTHSRDVAEIKGNLENLRFTYQVLSHSEEGTYESKGFENPEEALNFYISVADEQSPTLKCMITGSLGNFFYTCMAPLTLRSLTDIIDSNGAIPDAIKKSALEALAISIHKELPFNSEAHGCVI
jgi:hypothetical protein